MVHWYDDESLSCCAAIPRKYRQLSHSYAWNWAALLPWPDDQAASISFLPNNDRQGSRQISYWKNMNKIFNFSPEAERSYCQVVPLHKIKNLWHDSTAATRHYVCHLDQMHLFFKFNIIQFLCNKFQGETVFLFCNSIGSKINVLKLYIIIL